MTATDAYASIIGSLKDLGFETAAERLEGVPKPTPGDVAIVLADLASEKHNKKTEDLLRRAKIKEPRYFSRIIPLPERNLDMDYIDELSTLSFLKTGQNLVIWGPPGTGKSWFLTAFATKACEQGYKVRKISFPKLCRTLEKAKGRSDARFESKVNYFANFDVICIDEFPNDKSFNAFLLQEFFSEMEARKVRILTSSQSAPENWPKLLMVLSFGQSMTGRIAGNAKRLQLSGPDLRYRNDLDLD